ncbi:EamA-like transporter family protein [Allopseudospirillum japonicum]|uniref:EamA-like transporter family protein n=1 Tax=Allopseudospirillum japonicum TaxID=64971 RepID=A0A1H6TJD5_9GAMM|nr:DMT family transporter [Allopseudospirillum japonicum]SEI80169.1 EamA-like transporter family protein [Allopseudospirillum japonicum]
MSAWKGIAFRLLATGLFAGMALCVKKASVDAPVGQIVFWRSSLALIPIIVYLLYFNAFPKGLKTNNWKGHLQRSLYGCLAMFLSFISLSYLPLSIAAIFSFLAPLLAIPMASIYLGEKPSLYLICMVIFGFLGVLVTLLPSLYAPEITHAFLFGSGAGLLMAIVTALAKVKIKQLTKTEHAGSIAFYFALTCALVGAVTRFWGWPSLSSESLIWLVGAGLLGGSAHVVMTEAMARAPISTLAVFEYSAIFWALGLDYSFFGDIPDPISILGIMMIALAGLSVLRAQKIS